MNTQDILERVDCTVAIDRVMGSRTRAAFAEAMAAGGRAGMAPADYLDIALRTGLHDLAVEGWWETKGQHSRFDPAGLGERRGIPRELAKALMDCAIITSVVVGYDHLPSVMALANTAAVYVRGAIDTLGGWDGQ